MNGVFAPVAGVDGAASVVFEVEPNAGVERGCVNVDELGAENAKAGALIPAVGTEPAAPNTNLAPVAPDAGVKSVSPLAPNDGADMVTFPDEPPKIEALFADPATASTWVLGAGDELKMGPLDAAAATKSIGFDAAPVGSPVALFSGCASDASLSDTAALVLENGFEKEPEGNSEDDDVGPNCDPDFPNGSVLNAGASAAAAPKPAVADAGAALSIGAVLGSVGGAADEDDAKLNAAGSFDAALSASGATSAV
mmetsp:Transcript_13975/g.37520  ORF Transcript_13975/g.37520 Transcript_13975/m.37520 type:complete len:253 (-) Transcript_13975:181-939(-)